MDEATNTILEEAVRHLLRPLVRVLLRHGIPFQGFAELAKTAYVEVARDEFALPGRKVSRSRISVLTGLSRKEVKRCAEGDRRALESLTTRNQRAAAVLTGWLRDPEFTDGSGDPLALQPDGPGATFHALVRRYGRDAPHRAVLDELVRVGAVGRDANGRVTPSERGYVPTQGAPEHLQMLGADVADLVNVIDHNMQANGGPRYLQRKVSYDNIPEEHLEALCRLATDQGGNLLEEVDAEFALRDRDVNPATGGTGRNRVTLGVYYWQQPHHPADGEAVAPSPGESAGTPGDRTGDR
jgi:hypothetical protein